MLPRKFLLWDRAAGVAPDDLIVKVLVSKDLVHLNLDVVARMPVTMNKDAPRFLQQPLHFVESSVEPYEVARHAPLPNVGEGPQFILVAKNHVVLATRKEGGVDVNHADAFGRQLAHDM